MWTVCAAQSSYRMNRRPCWRRKPPGRAIIGVEQKAGGASLPAARYIVPGWEFVTEELAGLVLRRHLGLPWTIGVTERLLIRELTMGDREAIPVSELKAGEAMFGDPEMLRAYIGGQYGFYEYGTWAILERDSGHLAGLAGVSQPRLPGGAGTAPERTHRRELPGPGVSGAGLSYFPAVPAERLRFGSLPGDSGLHLPGAVLPRLRHDRK